MKANKDLEIFRRDMFLYHCFNATNYKLENSRDISTIKVTRERFPPLSTVLECAYKLATFIPLLSMIESPSFGD